MNVEEKSDDLMDLIAKFEKMEIVDKMDWEALWYDTFEELCPIGSIWSVHALHMYYH